MKKYAALALIPLAVLAGCGGGGGGGGGEESTSEPVYPVDAPLSAFFSQRAVYTLRAKDENGVDYTLSYFQNPGPDMSLGGSSIKNPLKTFRMSFIVGFNSREASFLGAEIYYSTNPFRIWGIDGANFEQHPHELRPAPTAARAKTSGVLAAGRLTTPSGNLYDPYPRTINWTLEEETASTAWLCFSQTFEEIKRAAAGCIRIDESGASSGFKAKATVSGVRTMLEFR